ncbi:tight adherence protein C [Anoxybacillus voinovskiensis]|uniref:Tight adherence protein C n=1 Tax=Anoxybacteroides voinovskiense TaxID=230470 RepID=A0A840DJ97_9BACL|nr:type II secretion system F family protein [Anoxybacillus voinovskiensis]MBB4073381.1 tight adherence protein C [Anoxybacillus voinovskiensis]GGJ61717.1 type II secretion system protein [Anoxybacillus voinovskiensis]
MYVTFFFTVTLFVYALFISRTERKERVKRRLAVFVLEDMEHQQKETNELPFVQRVAIPLWREWKRSVKKKMSGEKKEKLEQKLWQAGNPFGMTSVEFRLLQMVSLFLSPVACSGYALLLHLPIGAAVGFGMIGVAAGGYLPHMYINQKIKARHQQALRELPDVLDLLTVSLEAGLGFDGALSKVVAKKDGVLAREFHRCLEEIRLGKPRREALAGVRERIVVNEVQSFINSVLQAEKLGIGMVQVLRVQSAEAREQRRQRAEEAAMKAPIKMLFPLVLFIFPSLFIVLLGPAILQFLQMFK